ncbi:MULTISPECIES: hypothetical protein [Thermomonospora]|uniref:DUF1877 family protein n=1 Tax=Thermomonospora cellulosilytica TaxID=1411118 RepID=A0A7W3MYC6_9ACTN|nr:MULTISPECIES: hypothetical protein [Thermomonospora]MBA9004179.1 hypothetical protein [Thermomonospora cellulosilytica]
MGVIFEYFRAADRDTARARLLSTPYGTPEPAVDAVDTKGYDPFVVMGRLMALVLNRPWSPDLVSEEIIWPEEPYPENEEDLPEDSPWNSGVVLVELPASFRDAFADVDDYALPWIADQWHRIEELDGGVDAGLALDFIEEFVAFTRRAEQAGDRLYCLMVA